MMNRRGQTSMLMRDSNPRSQGPKDQVLRLRAATGTGHNNWYYYVKAAVQLHKIKAQGEKRYSSYSFMTPALVGGKWWGLRPGLALIPRKGPPVSILQEAGWAPGPVWTQRLQEKSFASAGIEPRSSRSGTIVTELPQLIRDLVLNLKG
jgi:hypothetical protein